MRKTSTLAKKAYSYKLLLPWFALFLVFYAVPNLSGFYFAFTNWNLREARFVGLENFLTFFRDPNLSTAFRNTFIFAGVTVVLKITLSLALALLVNKALRVRDYLRTIYFLPVIMNYVAVGLVFAAILHPQNGPLNVGLRAVGLDFLAANWLVDRDIVIFSIAGIEVWKSTGFHLAIFVAGLQAIPGEYYEAARVDGVSSWQRFRFITLPLLIPTVTVNVVFALLGGLRVFELVYATTGGGPGFYSEVLRTVIFKSFSMGRFGLATAGELILFVLVTVITLTVKGLIDRKQAEVVS